MMNPARLFTFARHQDVDTLHQEKNDSGISINSKGSSPFKSSTITSASTSATSHQEYLDSLIPPTPGQRERISMVQEQKEEEISSRRSAEVQQAQAHVEAQNQTPPLDGQHDNNDDDRTKAAGLIQRNYRGYRARRKLDGMGLDPDTRWVEALKEAKYRNMTQPRPRESLDTQNGRPSVETTGAESTASGNRSSAAMQNWRKVAAIARRAGEDDISEGSSEDEEGLDEAAREERAKRRKEERIARQKAAKQMDLQYFLEMVDHKHRYGSNLRTYHEAWKKAKTNENFFYWLDYGEGTQVECEGCPRERLDREQVRYLSKEERQDYLVKIDDEGRLCWAKNGARIDTTEDYRDSIHGIVPVSDTTSPVYREEFLKKSSREATSSPSSDSSDSHGNHHEPKSTNDEDEAARAGKYANPVLSQAPPLKKIKHVSAATIFNRLLRTTIKKNTWIFVADTSFRLYVGIKQSGAFQHSSFLHGSRIAAAGLIKIKNGRLSKLSPLSGHYRPPASNFRAFVHALKSRGVDMSHVSISRSYAVLVGLEAYVRSRRRGKRILQNLVHAKDVALRPEETRQKEMEARDKSQSAEKERQYLASIAGENDKSGFLDKLERLRLGEAGLSQESANKTADENVAASGKSKSSGPTSADGTQPLSEKGNEQKSDDGRAGRDADIRHDTDHLLSNETEEMNDSLNHGEVKKQQTSSQIQRSVSDIEIQVPGQGPENAIAPEGTRKD